MAEAAAPAPAAAGPAFGEGLPIPQRRRAYLALSATTMMAVLDGTIANVALPTIARQTHVTPALSIWVVSGFQMALTAALFTWSSIGQAYGLARAWRYGVAIFTAGSLCCSLSHTLPLLVASRMLQGIGAAGIMALGPALLRLIFPREQLGRALGINSLLVATGVAAGPTLGGAILAIASWPWLFLINVPIGIAVALAIRGLYPPEHGHGQGLDAPSIVTSALGFALIVHGIDGVARGEGPALIALEIAVGVATFGWFLVRQRRLDPPMFAVDLYARPLFAFASLSGFLAFTASTLAVVALPFLFQVQLGATPLQSGLLMTPWPLAMGLTANFAGRLSDRYPAGILSTLGAGTLGVGLALYALLPRHPSVVEIALHGALCGLGFGLFQAPNSRGLMAAAPREKTGSAAAILAATRVSGQTCGAAVVAMIFAAFSATLTAHGAGASPHARDAVPVALWVGAGVAFAAALASSVRLQFPGARGRGLSRDRSTPRPESA